MFAEALKFQEYMSYINLVKGLRYGCDFLNLFISENHNNVKCQVCCIAAHLSTYLAFPQQAIGGTNPLHSPQEYRKDQTTDTPALTTSNLQE